MNHTEWHQDQADASKKRADKEEELKAERDQILNGYDWVKVPRYYEVDPNNEDIDWKFIS